MASELQTRDPETYAIIGAAMAVHSELGHGFLEAVYHEALSMELADRGIAHDLEVGIPVRYKKRTLKCRYKADIVCVGDIIVEIKALNHLLTGTERSQVINYLKATGFKKAIVLNFGMPSLKYERIVLGLEESKNSQ